MSCHTRDALHLRIKRAPWRCSSFLWFVKTSHFELFHTYFCRCKQSIKLAQEHTKIELATIRQTEQEHKVQHRLSGSCYVCDRYGSQTRLLLAFPNSILRLGSLVQKHILHRLLKIALNMDLFPKVSVLKSSITSLLLYWSIILVDSIGSVALYMYKL